MDNKETVLYYMTDREAKSIIEYIQENETLHNGAKKEILELMGNYSNSEIRDRMFSIQTSLWVKLVKTDYPQITNRDYKFDSAILYLLSKANEKHYVTETYFEIDELFKGEFGEVKLDGFFLQISQPSQSRVKQLRKKYLTELSEALDRNIVERTSVTFFDTKLVNKFGTLRRKIYNKINELCIVLQKVENKYLYLLPTSNVVQFIQEVEIVNREYQDLKEGLLIDYELLKSNEALNEYLEEKKMRLKKPPTDNFRVYYDLQKVSFDTSVLKEAVKTDVSEKVDKTVRQALEKYDREINERMTKVLLELEHDLLKSMTELLKLTTNAILRFKDTNDILSVAIERDYSRLLEKTKVAGLKELEKTTSIMLDCIKAQRTRDYKDMENFATNLTSKLGLPQPDKTGDRYTVKQLNDMLVYASSSLAGVCDKRVLAIKRNMARLHNNGG